MFFSGSERLVSSEFECLCSSSRSRFSYWAYLLRSVWQS